MDLCCEPEIAGAAAVVAGRIVGTVRLLGECKKEAQRLCIPGPMPILQGWHPEDYLRCADLMAAEIGEWPDLVGIGSVCRRQIGGPDGLVAVVGAISRHLPKHVRFHLFGVKGDALQLILPSWRVESVDSCAYDYASRKSVAKERRDLQKSAGVTMREATAAIPHRKASRAVAMHEWMSKQSAVVPSSQMRLF